MWLWWLTSPNLKCEPPRLIRVNGTVLLWWMTALRPRKDSGASEVERQTAEVTFSFLHGRGSGFFFYSNVQLIRYSLPEVWRAMFFPVLTNSRLPRGFSGKEFSGQCRRHKGHCSFPGVGKILWSRKWQPFQYSCLENPMDRGAWRAILHGVTVRHDWVHCWFKC